MGSEPRLGNVPSSLGNSTSNSAASFCSIKGSRTPAIPLPASATIFIPEKALADTPLSTNRCHAVEISFLVTFPVFLASTNIPFSIRRLICFKPSVSVNGTAPALTNFSPLYSFGLWEAVIITPGKSKEPEAKYNPGECIKPMSITSAPESVAPLINAACRYGDDSRISRATIIFVYLPSSTNARAVKYTTSSSISVGYTPRISASLNARV